MSLSSKTRRYESMVLSKLVWVLISDGPHTAAGDHSADSNTKASMVPQNKLSIGSIPLPLVEVLISRKCKNILAVQLRHMQHNLIQD